VTTVQPMQSYEGRSSDDGTAFESGGKPLEALFVHGMFLRGHEAFGLALGMARHSIRLRRFRYYSRTEEPEAVAERLAGRLRTMPDLHIVAHSFGGLLALAAIARAPEWQGRAVLLGSPLRGSGVARRTLQLPGGEFVLGKAADWLTRGLEGPVVPPGRVAVIVGTRNIGIGRFLSPELEAGDGIVSLDETGLEGAAESLRYDTIHLGLVYNRRVIDRVVRFIRAEA